MEKEFSLNETEIEIRFVENDSSYQPIMYEELPAEIQNEIDELASELVDPDRGHVLVMGTPQAGKTFLINQLVGNFERYTEKLNREQMRFIRLEVEEFDSNMFFDGFNTYINTLKDELECDESSICFVTENPMIASKLFSLSKKVRIILEASRSTFLNIAHMETSGSTKMWAGWRYSDATETLLKKQDLINIIHVALHDRVKKTFNVDLTKKTVTLFVNHALKQVPEIIGKDEENKNRVLVPIGNWIVALRRLSGVLGLSESAALQNKNGSINLGKVIHNVFKDSQLVFESFAPKAEDNSNEGKIIAVAGPNGEIIKAQVISGDPSRSAKASSDKASDEQATIKKLVFKDMKEFPERVSKKVIGQDSAIQEIADGLIVPAAGLNDSSKPVRSILFLGPTGVGKTKMAQTIAEEAYTEPMNFVRIDMSEFSQPHEATKLLGAPPGYTGFEQGGVLTNAVKKHPNSLIMLDEVEKAHPKVWDSFLQILDAGRMTDGLGHTVDFTQTIVIFTSNIGAAEIKNTALGFTTMNEEQAYSDRQRDTKRIVEKALDQTFRAEMINRIDEIVIFNEISKDTAYKIVMQEIDLVAERMNGSGFKLDGISTDIIEEILAKSNIRKFGAREIQRVVLKNISNPIAHSMIGNKDSKGLPVLVSLVLNQDKIISVK